MADNNEKFVHLANLEKLAQGLQSKFQNEMFEMLPCYDTREQGSINLTFDGNIQDKETVSVMDGVVNFVNLYKNVTIDDIYGLQDGTITVTSATSEGNQDITISIASIGGIQEYNEHIYLCNGGIFCVVLQDSFFEMYETTLTKGIWVVLLPVTGGTSYASALSYKKIISGELKIIDDKYLENKPGFKTENKTLYSIFSEQEYIGQSGAEIFNNSNIAVGMNSHAEGYMTEAIGPMTHTEGYMTSAEYDYSHAEGSGTIARGSAAHCEGKYAIANGNASHAEGYGTIASGAYQHAQGKYNIEDTENKYAHIVGNGTSSEKASNAHTLDWDGNAWFAGKITAEGEPVDNKDLVNKEYVDNAISNKKDVLISDSISNNVLNLTTDKYQKVEMVDGTEIVLPSVTDFTEIHLYFTALSDLTLIFPVGKYQKTPEIKANKTYEFIFTYIGEWLIGFIEYGN